MTTLKKPPDNNPKALSLPTLLESMSARLLLLTVVFVMLAEVLIWTPSVSRYRKVYLEDHLLRAHLSTLALEAMPEQQVGKAIERDLLLHTGAYGIVVSDPHYRTLMVQKDMPPKVDKIIDMQASDSMYMWIMEAFETLAQDENRVLRVIGVSPKKADVMVEILIDEAPMRTEMVDFSTRILTLSIVISLFTAGLLYISLQWLMIRPMRQITASMASFQAAPEDETRTIPVSTRRDEIGVAQRQLAVLQGDVRTALRQKSRLATLGAAVAKVNHDLRNSLATAVLAYDKLADIDDPEVKLVLPNLYNSIDRAVKLCSQTLTYVSEDTIVLTKDRFHLQELITEVSSVLKEMAPDITIKNQLVFEVDVEADRQQLFRVFQNLILNSAEAGAKIATITAAIIGNRIEIEVLDDGPGLSQVAQKKLFEPFAGSTRTGGSGLGLVIVRDILKAHGGNVELVASSEDGTHFQLSLPRRNLPGEDQPLRQVLQA